MALRKMLKLGLDDLLVDGRVNSSIPYPSGFGSFILRRRAGVGSLRDLGGGPARDKPQYWSVQAP